MKKDHFVAQTYLRQFGDPSRKGMLHAYRKSDGKYFPCNTKDVCHEWDGDLNPLLKEKNALGEFRQLFERNWNPSIAALLSKTMTPNDMFGVSGYFANLMVCTPAWRRLAVKMYNDHAKSLLSFSKEMQKKHGGNPTLPIEAIEMIERGEIILDHDPNYIKAKATESLMEYAWLTYHQDWTIIRNPSSRPFITSDNPVAIRQTASPIPHGPITRFLPITPALCLSVRYDRTNLPAIDPSMPPKGMVKWGTANEEGVNMINTLVAQCAEDLVFSSTQSSEVEALVKSCATFRVDADFVRLPSKEPDTVYEGSIVRVRDMSKASSNAASKSSPR